jgi:type IV fimbrial biogenesis protein FimT
MSRRQAGLTLIEIVIAVAVLAILIALAVPSYRAWIQNSQIRTAAESILNGLQTARAEAVKRNVRTELEIGAGTDWSIKLMPAGDVIQSRSSAEGSANAQLATQPAGATRITFNGMGWIAANDDATPSITRVDVTSTVVTGTEARPLRLVITPGGSVKMCDPQVAADDPRVCP